MRGGAIPLIAWALLISVLLAINWIWTDDAIQVATFAFAVMAVLAGAGLLVWRDRQSLRPGPPGPPTGPETLPTASVGAVLCAVAAASIVFGLAFGPFLVDFGAALLVASLARVTVEVLGERRSRERARRTQRG
jgi:hypothetical protein